MNLSCSTAMLITLHVRLSYAWAVAYFVVKSSAKIAEPAAVVTSLGDFLINPWANGAGAHISEGADARERVLLFLPTLLAVVPASAKH
jgi:hypothetical protein